MRVALVQMSATTDKAANLKVAERLVARAAESRPDLVMLPEAVMHDFGRPDEPLTEAAEPLDGPFVAELQRLSRLHGAMVVAGMFEAAPDEERPYNSLVAVDAGGIRGVYRKTHLYDSFGYRESDKLLAAPPEAVVVPVADLKLGLMTCYDLRFPEMARALVDAGADTLGVPAAWVAGEHKVDHWQTLLRARAIENTCFVVAAAQCGRLYCGHSAAVDPMGVVLTSLGDDEGVASASLASGAIFGTRQQNPALAHRRFAVVPVAAPVSSPASSPASSAASSAASAPSSRR
ncbi:MAG: carbon-nitrogen hydrolase family protein [Actinomycetota bacterium]|nr:carbon-nitrogen hydrolase family protein [Actinomycetota bacterium]